MSANRRLLRSSLVVLFFLGINKVTGFIKLLLVTRQFGVGLEADAFAAANQVQELLVSMLVGGALSAALIPVYSAYLTQKDEEGAQKLAHTVLTLAMLLMALVCGVAAFAAPWFTRTLLVPEFSPVQQGLTTDLVRVALLVTALVSLSSVLTSLLNAHQHFWTPALGTVAIDSGYIVGLLLWSPSWGIYGLAWGGVLGSLAMIGVQLPAFLSQGPGFRPQLGLKLPGVGRIARLIGPRVVSLGIAQAVDLIFVRLASPLPPGSISAFFYAFLVMVGMPRSLFGTAISQVLFPTLAEQYNTGQGNFLRQRVTQGLRATWVLLAPAALGLVALGSPAMVFLFQRGAWGGDATHLLYGLVVILALRLLGDASQELLALSFYARHNTRTPMLASLGWMVINVALSIWWVKPFGIYGLAWATTISSVAHTALLYWLNRSQTQDVDLPTLLQTLSRVALAGGGLVGVILWVRQWPLTPGIYTFTAIGLGGLTYVGIYLWIGRGEIRALWQGIR